MQEDFSLMQAYQNANAIATKGYSLPGAPTVMQQIYKKYNKNEINKKGTVDGYYPSGVSLRDGYYSTEHENEPNRNYNGNVTNFSGDRGGMNVPQPMFRKLAGNMNNFSGKIDDSKYGEYGSSMNKPAETFCPGLSNSRLMGASLDTSWASGTTDGITKANIQPFNPKRYPQGRA